MKLKIGLIGSGFARVHVDALAQIPDAEVVAICSRNEASAQALIGSSGAKYYPFDDYLEMLKKEQLDAIYLCLPPHLHGDIEIACSEYVKGLFLEKPIALNLGLAGRMNDAFKKSGNIVSVGYMNRYRKNILKAKDYFSNDPAVLINAAWSGTLPPPYWWRRRELSGGQLTEQATHLIDSIRYISGEVKEIQAVSTRGFIDNVEDFNGDDALVMNMQLESGAIGSVQTSCFSKDHGGGALGVYLEMASREKSFRFKNHSMDLSIQHSADHYEKFRSVDSPILAENMAFIKGLKDNSHAGIHSTFEDAIESLKVSLAADLSILESRSVAIASL